MKHLLLNLCVVSYLISSCNNSTNSSNSNETQNIDSNSIKKEKIEPEILISTVKIGKQEWMDVDIKTTKYNNGDPIFEAKNEKKWQEYGNKRVGCYRKLSNGTFVYNGFAVNDSRGIIPAGFTLPTFKQFQTLISFLGGGDYQAGKATQSLATYSIFIEKWVEGKNNENGEDEGSLEELVIKSNGKSGFKAKPGGFVYDHGALDNEGNCSYWWTSSIEGEGTKAFDIGYCSQDLGGGFSSFSPSFGFAVRAIKK